MHGYCIKGALEGAASACELRNRDTSIMGIDQPKVSALLNARLAISGLPTYAFGD